MFIEHPQSQMDHAPMGRQMRRMTHLTLENIPSLYARMRVRVENYCYGMSEASIHLCLNPIVSLLSPSCRCTGSCEQANS